MINICKACGVELEQEMQVCPLCDTPANAAVAKTATNERKEFNAIADKKRYSLNRILLQIVAILLLSGIAATLIINLAIQGRVTWSVYPIFICLILLFYALLFSLWHTRPSFQLLGGWALSAGVLFMLSSIIDSTWPVRLALPLLSALNIMAFLLMGVLKGMRIKGLNIFAISLLAIALLCLAIEAIISFYVNKDIKFEWSAIVAACLLPVAIAIFFMYFKTRNNSELKKIFHT